MPTPDQRLTEFARLVGTDVGRLRRDVDGLRGRPAPNILPIATGTLLGVLAALLTLL